MYGAFGKQKKYGLRLDLEGSRELWDRVGKVGKGLLNKLGIHPTNNEKSLKGFNEGLMRCEISFCTALLIAVSR